MKIITLSFIVLLVTNMFCSLTWNDAADDPVSVFDYFWSEMDKNYAGFITKDIDWNIVRERHRPNVVANPTEDILLLTIKEIIDLLNDKHILIMSKKNDVYPPYVKTHFSYALVTKQIEIEYDDYNYSFGKKNNLAYLHIKEFSGDDNNFGGKPASWAMNVKNVLSGLEDCDGLIIDVRNNEGGNGNNAIEIARSFLTSDFKYAFVSKYKTGPGGEQYTIRYEDIVQSSYRFTKPVVVLVNELSMSATDIFIVILQKYCNIHIIGVNTIYTSIGNCRLTELPNGWVIKFGTMSFETSDGSYKDGDTIIVDEEVINSAEDIEAGIDAQLYAAMDYLKTLETLMKTMGHTE